MKTEPPYTKFSVVMFVLLVMILIGSVVAMAVEIGEQAPDFTLPSTTGKVISLSQFKDKMHVLIQFYTQDFNPV